ncbi:MAG: response regulator transcription factor [Candidatus Binataceae bacterium]|nr:response regulator transcription factor [Candidatus Binataceae bacterium]
MIIRVLLADDHGVVAEGLRALIDSQPDMKVTGVAADGRDAIRLARDTSPDVMVMDNMMPVLNGIEATQMVRQRRSNVRILMLSMHSDAMHVRRALQAGAQGYVLKQSVGNDLLDAIRAVHAGRRYLSAPLADELIEHVMSDAPRDPLARLSARERQILKMIAEGRSTVEIATQLSLSRKTVETYRARMMEKLKVDNLAGLVKLAIRQGVVELG